MFWGKNPYFFLNFILGCTRTTAQKRKLASGFLSSEAKQFLRREIAKFNTKEKLERAKTPPSSWYLGDEFYMLDRGAIIRSNVSAVESLHRLQPGPKSFMTGSIAGEQYLFTRPDNNEIVKGFYNICRHHGITLEWKDCGKSDEFACPYHGWVFDNEGHLVKTTKMGGIECFRSKDYRLVGIDVFTYWPIAFAKPAKHLTAPGSSSDNRKRLYKIIQQVESSTFDKPERFISSKNYEHIHRKTYFLKCNWKMYVNNYLDNGYQFHGGTTQGTVLDFSNFKTHCYLTDEDSGHMYQISVQTATYKDDPKATVQFMHIYPNVIVQIYSIRPFFDVYYVLPTGPETTTLICDWFVTKEYLSNTRDEKDKRDEYIDNILALHEKTQSENLAICERSQEGSQSWGLTTSGRYVPAMEKAMHLFHKRLSADYLTYLDSEFVSD